MTSNPGYADQAGKRTLLRVVGVLSMGVALVLMGTAIADFVHSADSFEGPTKFWMFFLALPFFLVGGVGLQGGFMGAAARYSAGETMPVLKDSASYLSNGQGLMGVGRTEPANTATGPFCSRCGVRNDAEATFCDSCGSPLG